MNRLDLSVDIIEADRITQIRTKEPVSFFLYGRWETIKPGFVSDGASLPRFFWRFLGQPFEHAYLRAAVVHDYLYRTQICTRKEADTILFELMLNSSPCRAPIFWLGVRLFGWVAWQNNRSRFGIQKGNIKGFEQK